ncbi:MAG: YbaK/EbsC family protein [Phycisphaerae bacterium]|jgi:Ala-tRNA(Pro) deacylase
MSQPANPVFERLTAALEEAGIEFTHLHHDPVYTSPEAARVRGTPLHSGAKALILSARGAFRFAVMPADLSLNNNAVRKSLGCKRLRFATKDEVLEVTGLTPGSIPPFGSLFGLETICDPQLADNETIVFNAGSHTDSILMRYEDYFSHEKPRLARIAT